ncbi:MAG TPA: gamma-glutamylcyclotransferase [Methanosarcinales archaeon]|nr:gamma-glutamylcyclotransferase [Methanosarcinales archaeon]
MNKHKLFVYGTLKRGCSRHHVMQKYNAIYLGETITTEKFALIKIGNYPGVIKKSRYQIHGELYCISDSLLARLDIIEGVPYLYKREKVALASEEEAILYFYVGVYSKSDILDTGYWNCP